MIITLGGWTLITTTSAGVIGLAIVTAAGLVLAGANSSIAFWFEMRRTPPSSR